MFRPTGSHPLARYVIPEGDESTVGCDLRLSRKGPISIEGREYHLRELGRAPPLPEAHIKDVVERERLKVLDLAVLWIRIRDLVLTQPGQHLT
jgi:hypothetical protein